MKRGLTRSYSFSFYFLLVLVLGSISCSSNQHRGPGSINHSHGRDISIVPLAFHEKMDDHEAYSTEGMVVTQGDHSTKAGIEVLKQGGNAFDAAVAVSFALSVERPHSTGIGGGGFLLYYGPQMKAPLAVDFRERAPIHAHEKMFQDKQGKVIPNKSLDGILAQAVPGMVAGLLDIHEKHGSLPLDKVMAPAIKLAEEGFPVYEELELALQDRAQVLKKFPASREIFLQADGATPLKLGELLVQKDLAQTLKLIAQKGKDGFYKGPVAEAIVATHRKLGGKITQEDLQSYEVRYRRPVSGTYKGYQIYSMSPPSSGGVHILQILNILEGDSLQEQGVQAASTVHLVSSAMQLAFADRAKYLGDTDFVQVPVKGIISKEYAQNLRKKIDSNKATPQMDVAPGRPYLYESDQTVHFTIVDKAGHTVSSTQTINGLLGSGLVIPKTGILMNNEMDDFAAKVGEMNLFGAIGGHNNLVAPKKRPLSSMSPTIVFKDGSPVLALGTPSGTRILTCVTQTILNYVEHKLPLYEAVAAVRYHQQWYPDYIRMDEQGMNAATTKELEAMGHKIQLENLNCRVQAVAIEDGRLHGVSDPRGHGMAQGL